MKTPRHLPPEVWNTKSVLLMKQNALPHLQRMPFNRMSKRAETVYSRICLDHPLCSRAWVDHGHILALLFRKHGVPTVVQTHDICHITLVILSFKYQKGILIAVVCWSQPVNNQHCGWTGPCGSHYDCKTPLSTNYWETGKNKGLLLTGRGNYTAHLVPHCEVRGRERQRDGEREGGRERRILWARAWGPTFTGAWGGGLGFS